jgi:hypothetical protein
VGVELAYQADVPFSALSGRTLTAAHQGIVERFP